MVYIVIVLILIVTNLHAGSTIDSLYESLEHSKDDTNKVKLFINISDRLMEREPVKALEYLNKALELSEKTDYNYGKTQINLLMGNLSGKRGEIKKSQEYTHNAVKLAQQYNQNTLLAEAYMLTGINLTRISQYDKAAEFLFKSIELATEINYKKQIALSNLTLGTLYYKIKKYDKAIQTLENSIKMLKILKLKNYISMAYNNISNSYMELNRFNKAEEILRSAIEIDNELNDSNSLAIKYNNLGSINCYQRKFEESLYWFNKSIVIKQKVNNKIGIVFSSLGIAEVYDSLGKYKLSLAYLDAAINLLNDNRIPEPLMAAYKHYVDVYKKMNNYQQAYYYLELYHQLKDSILNTNKENTVSLWMEKFELSKKEKENEILRRQSQTQNYYIVISILIILIISIFVLALFIRNRSIRKINVILSENKNFIEGQNNELDNLNKELSETNAELNELNSMKDIFFSIISHDLRGPISSYNQLIESLKKNYKEFTEAERIEYIELLSQSSKNTYSLLENLLTWARLQLDRMDFNPVESDLSVIIENTINELSSQMLLKKIKVTKEISYKKQVRADAGMISTVIRNLLSNAIKFTPEHGEIIISVRKLNKEPVISIIDSGVGMSEKMISDLFKIDKTQTTLGTNQEKGTGLGLILCKDFVEKHGGKIWVNSKINEGTTFSFSLPV